MRISYGPAVPNDLPPNASRRLMMSSLVTRESAFAAAGGVVWLRPLPADASVTNTATVDVHFNSLIVASYETGAVRKRYSPPRIGGVAAPSQTLERRGRGGQSRMTTPSALSKVASRRFLDAQPPLLSQEGNTACKIQSRIPR